MSAGQFAAAFEASEQGRALQKAAETEYQRPDPYYEDLEPLIRRRCAFQSEHQLIQACIETQTHFVGGFISAADAGRQQLNELARLQAKELRNQALKLQN